MTASNHCRRDLTTRCLSHPFVEERSRSSSLTGSGAFFCRNCGLAYTPSAGYLLRPLRFEGVGSPSAPHSVLFNNMILRQRAHIPLSSEHINPGLRLEAIRKLYSLSGSYGLQKTTFVRAVALLDKFLSFAPLNPFDYYLVTFIILNLACKFGEQKPNTLSLSSIAELFPGSYGKEDVAMWEVHITSALGWNLDVQTAHDFANYFMWQGTATTADVESRPNPKSIDTDALLECLDALVTQVLDITLVDFRFYHYTPVALAASAIAMARELVGMTPWSVELRETTTFSMDTIGGCLKVVRLLIGQRDNLPMVSSILTRYHLEVPTCFLPRPTIANSDGSSPSPSNPPPNPANPSSPANTNRATPGPASPRISATVEPIFNEAAPEDASNIRTPPSRTKKISKGGSNSSLRRTGKTYSRASWSGDSRD